MATIKLKTTLAGKTGAPRADRAPVRGAGAARKRPTLAEAQDARAEREARYQEQLRQRYGDHPPESTRRGPPPDDARRSAPRKRASRAPEPNRNAAFEPANARSREDDRPPQRRAAPPPDRDPRPPAPYRGTRDDGRSSRPAKPYQGPRDDGRAARTKTDAFGNRVPPPPPAPPAPRGGPQPSPRANATARREAAALRRDDDDEETFHPEIPGSMRLSKRMSELGIASRREADEWIPKGWVRVDGQVVSELGSRVTPDQQITIDAKAKFVQAQKVTVLVNKPVGYVSGQAEDGYEPALVLVKPENHWREDQSGIRFIKDHLRYLAPAGRLDIDSTGLLVLTQDGRIAKQLIGEDRETEKEYLVRVQSLTGQPLPDESLQKLRHGLELDGEPLLPAHVEWINDDQLRFVLKEGKKRQIRRMCELVGLKVVGLKRVRIGRVMLGDLPVGAWRYLRLDERF